MRVATRKMSHPLLLADSAEPHTRISLQPLRVDVRPCCIHRLSEIAAAVPPPDSFSHRRLQAQRRLDSAEGRLRAQQESVAAEAFPVGVTVQVGGQQNDADVPIRHGRICLCIDVKPVILLCNGILREDLRHPVAGNPQCAVTGSGGAKNLNPADRHPADRWRPCSCVPRQPMDPVSCLRQAGSA